MAGKYKWKTGGKVHNIPLATHEQNAAAKKALGSLDLTAPPTANQALTEANSAADLQYGPQVQAAQQLQANVSPWFQDYLARVAGYAKAAQAQAAPVLQQAQTYQAGAAAQQAPGLDPASAAGQQSAQAAQGRQALAQSGLDALNAQNTATQDFFGGQQALAARVQPQVAATAQQNVANAQSQRGGAVQTYLTTARQNAQNYNIARGTLGLNSAKAQSDADQATAAETEKERHNATSEQTAVDRINAQSQTAADKQNAAAATPNKYGVPAGQWQNWSTSHRQRVMDAYAENHAKGGDDKTAAKHVTDVHAATGKVENQITDLIGKWNNHMSDQVDDTSKPLKDSSGKAPNTAGWKPTYAPRKPTAAELKKILGASYPEQMIHIALLRRAGKPLDQASIDYLRNLDPNFRIPREWLPYDPSITAGSPQDPKGGAGANK